MKKVFQKIYNLALPYQDKRNDKGHAKVVMDFAFKILNYKDADEAIVIPAAILHDVGWSQISEKERMKLFDTKLWSKKDQIIRECHQYEGVRVAKEILEKINYNPENIKVILEIISEHDTRKNPISEEDKIVKDADKLWMFSPEGFKADLFRRKIKPVDWIKVLQSVIGSKKFFTDTAALIAKEELEKRAKEYNDLGNLTLK